MISYDSMVLEVTARLGNRTDIGARIGRWINYAFFQAVLDKRFEFKELDYVAAASADGLTSNPVTTVGVAKINLGTTFPDLYALIDIRIGSPVTVNTTRTKLRKISAREYDKTFPTSGMPVRYFLFEPTTIILDPIPDAVYDLYIRYRKRPNEATSGSTFAGLGVEWEEVLVVMATIKGAQALGLVEIAAMQMQLLSQLWLTRQSIAEVEAEDDEITISPAIGYRA